jgi:hypothetical protein
MTGKADFSAEEWDLLLQAPPSAGAIVVFADRGGSIRESFSMAKIYAEAREGNGKSELLDEIVSAKPEMDHSRFKSPEELREHCLQTLRDAVELLGRKATQEEVEEYKKFLLGLADRVANARREGFMGLRGERVSDAEREAFGEIAAAVA